MLLGFFQPLAQWPRDDNFRKANADDASSKQGGVSQNEGYLFGGPYNKDYGILGCILASPYLGKLPQCLPRYRVQDVWHPHLHTVNICSPQSI